MDCHLCSTKPLAEPVPIYCQSDHHEQTSAKFKQNTSFFIFKKCDGSCRLLDVQHLIQA